MTAAGLEDRVTGGSHRRQLAVYCIVIFALALVVRLWFVQQVLDQFERLPAQAQRSSAYGFLVPDSPTYLQPARRLTEGSLLDAGSLTRPPLYPAFLAACRLRPGAILRGQALLGSLIPVCAFLLSFWLLRSPHAAAVAASLGVASPTGVGLTGLILADLLLALLFCGATLVLLIAPTRRRPLSLAVLAGLLFGCAALAKPLLWAWPIGLCAVLWLFFRAHGRPVRASVMLLTLSLQVLPMALWATRNLSREGVFALSSVGPRALRLYLAVRTEEWARHRRLPPAGAVSANRAAARQRIEAMALEPRQEIQTYVTEAMEIVRRTPGYAARTFAQNAREPATQGWDQFPRQVPLEPSLLKALLKASEIESAVKLALWIPVTLGIPLIWLLSRGRGPIETRRLLLTTIGFTLAILYFGLSAGFTFWTGPRILYPVEPICLAIAVTEACLLFGWLQRRFARSATASG